MFRRGEILPAGLCSWAKNLKVVRGERRRDGRQDSGNGDFLNHDGIHSKVEALALLVIGAKTRMVAADGPWAGRLVPIAKTRAVIGALDSYYRLLVPICSKIDLWQTIYVQELRPFLEVLSPLRT